MTSTKKPPKFDYHLLALLGWLSENPNARLLSSYGAGLDQNYPTLYELSPKREDGKRSIAQVFPARDSRASDESVELVKRLGGRVSNDYHKLLQQGFLLSMSSMYENTKAFEKFVSTLEPRHEFHWSQKMFLLTKKGFEYWNEAGKAHYEKLHAKRLAAREEADRLILIGVDGVVRPILPERLEKMVNGAGLRLPDISRKVVRPYAIARVTKETATRFYVEDVDLLQGDAYALSGGHSGSPIEGRAPNQYVEKKHVMLDNATKAGAARVVSTDVEYADDLRGIMLASLQQIIPLLSEMNLRLAQKGSERDDMMGELLQSLREEGGRSEPKRERKAASPKP